MTIPDSVIEQLYKDTYPVIYKWLNLYKSQLREDVKLIARDLLHDAMPILLDHIQKGKYDSEKSQLRTYLVGICKGLWMNQIRKKDNQFKTDIDMIQEKENFLSEENILEAITNKETLSMLEKCVGNLKDKYQTIIALRFYEELSWKEVAEKMQYSNEHTAMMTGKRALEMLQTCMGSR